MFTVENPATGEIIAELPEHSAAEVVAMAARGRAVQPAWEALGFDGRGQVLSRMRSWLLDHRDEIIAVIRSETGKTYEDALSAEFLYGASAFSFWADHAPVYLADERVRSSSLLMIGRRLGMRWRPVGLVGVIGPWNYPLTNSFGDAIPALAAGNSVLLKPSEVTPLTSLRLAEGLRECGLPQDVLQIATGAATTGAALIENVDMAMFTGSTATGRKVLERAARTLTPVSLELGGKDAMIVCGDADLKRAAATAVYYAMFNAGQTCISIERVYVEASVYGRFTELVAQRVRHLRLGAGYRGSAEVGAMTFPPQVEIVERHLRDARAKGARVLVGGHRPARDGYWFEPTVLVDVDHTMECMREETFGPTLPIMSVASVEQAIALANDSPYGLGASVFSGDRKRADAIARRLDVGAVCINDAVINYTALELPMGGSKSSGHGVRHGRDGIRKYCRRQSVLVAGKVPLRQMHMYPYTPRRTGLLVRALTAVLRLGRR